MDKLKLKKPDGTEYPTGKIVKIKNVCKFITSKHIEPEETGKYILMDMGTVNSRGEKLYHKKTNINLPILEKGDLVMPKDDIGTGLIICKTAYIDKNDTYVLSDHIYGIKCNDCNSFYLHLLLNSKKYHDKLYKYVTGSAVKGVTHKDFENEEIYLPSIEEQNAIVELLAPYETQLSNARSYRDNLILEKKSMIQKIFNQEVRFKKDDGSDFEDWEEKKLSEIVKFKKGKGLSWNDIEKNGKNKCILYGNLYTEYGAIINNVVFSTNNNLKDFILSKKGDVLIPASDTTPTGLARASCIMIDDVILGGDINILTPNKETSGKYLSYCINSNKEKLIKIIQGSTVRHLKNEDIANVKIFISKSLEEQEKIANCLSNYDTAIETQNKIIEETEKLYNGLLQRLF